MKKFACGLICMLIAFALTSCDIDSLVHSLGALVNEETSGANESIVSNEEQTTFEAIMDTDVDSDSLDNSDTDSSDTLDADSVETSTDTDTNTDDSSTVLDNVNNGVLKESSCETMKVPENMKFLQTGEATEGNKAKDILATVVLYRLDGDVVNWATENDFIYVITAGNNRLVMIDSMNMSPVYNTPLAAQPAEMNIIGDRIYISFPDLCRIDIFSKADGQKQSSIYFDHEVSSFCLDGDYIYYSEHDQHCRVFKKNLSTDEVTTVPDGSYRTFYFPKLYLNKEDGILYIGESGSTGSALYYYDAETLSLLSVFEKNNYGIMNNTREIFHVGDHIFWGNYCLSDTNAKELTGRYGTASYGSVVFASEEIVSTYEGLFLTDTYECIVDYFEADNEFQYILVSESYNVFFRTRSFDTNIIVGINFKLQ